MIPESLSPIANHLWQSTLFAGAAWLLTLALRKNPARVRHWVWVAASVKFLIPFSVLIAMGGHMPAPAGQPANSAQRYQEWHWAKSANGRSGPRQFFRPPQLAKRVPESANKAPAILFRRIWASCGLSKISTHGGFAGGVSPLLFAAEIAADNSPHHSMQYLLPHLLEPGIFSVVPFVLLLPEGSSNT